MGHPFYKPEDTAIHRYHDGERAVFADPLELRRRLVIAAGGDLASLAEAALPPEGGPPEAPEATLARAEAQGRLAAVVREAFRLKPFDPDTGRGVTEAMCWRVWDDFHEGLEGNGPPPGS